MTTFVVFGDESAPDKLTTATLNDYLDNWSESGNDEWFHFIFATRGRPTHTLNHVMDWCEKSGVAFDVYIPSGNTAVRPEADSWNVTDNFLIDAVSAGFSYSGDDTIVLALVGEAEAAPDVTRAIARAISSHMVVRDLTEGALTYINFHGDSVDTPSSEDEPMSEEEEETEVTIDELVSMAVEGDEEALEALNEACAEFNIDPDAYGWEEIGAVLEAAMEGASEEDPETEEEAEEVSEPEGGWTATALKGMTLKEVREHAAAAGIDDAKTAPRPKLVKALVDGTSAEGEEEEEEEETPAPAPAPAPQKSKPTPVDSGGSIDYGKLAKAIVDEIVIRLS